MLGITRPITVEQIRPGIIRKTTSQATALKEIEPDLPVPFAWGWLSILAGLFFIGLISVTVIEFKVLADSTLATTLFSFSEPTKLLSLWQKVINIF